MRAVSLWAVLAGLLAALTGPPGGRPPAPAGTGTDDLRRRADAVVRHDPDIWAGAREARGRRSLVIGGPRADPRDLADIARRADRASGIVAGVAGAVRSPGPAETFLHPLILVPATTGQAARLAAPTAVNGLAAVAGTDRVVVEPGSFARLSATGRDVVLAHELTHLATGAATDGRTPKWLVEGFADYVGYLRAGVPVPVAAAELAAEVRAGRPPRALPGRDAFAPGSARPAQAYEEAWLACRYVADRFGEPALVSLYRETMREGAPAAFARVLGTTEARFTDGWRAYVRKSLSPAP
ncbi:hypothetical protein [Sphaerisporangium fuscum]|uniref:hypothetical protein n=1 Tax=Sphaerisporangium fuscum TaxID=2835868 RepID=UPI001BDDB55C|nr:hypothetical protein [Sphaerisporangium fuscum]